MSQDGGRKSLEESIGRMGTSRNHYFPVKGYRDGKRRLSICLHVFERERWGFWSCTFAISDMVLAGLFWGGDELGAQQVQFMGIAKVNAKYIAKDTDAKYQPNP